MPNRKAKGESQPTSLQTKKSALKARVRKTIIAELERDHYQGRSRSDGSACKGRKLTDADIKAIVATIADDRFHQEYDQILRELGPHLSSAIKVLVSIAKPDGSVSPQHCHECHARRKPGSVAATKGDTRLAELVARHTGFRELSELGSSAPVRVLAERLLSFERLHAAGSWKSNPVRLMASDPLLLVPWRRTRDDVKTRDRALLALLAGSWPTIEPDAEPEQVIQAEMDCLRKQMRRADMKRKRKQPPRHRT